MNVTMNVALVAKNPALYHGEMLKAVLQENHGLLHALVLGGTDVNARMLTEGETGGQGSVASTTPLYYASLLGLHTVAKTLLTLGAGVHVGGIEGAQMDGATALFAACINGHVKVGEVLICAGADVNATERTYGETPLLVASHGGHLRMGTMLLQAGAHVDKASDDGGTPLLAAVERRELEMVKLLIANGANVNLGYTIDVIGAYPLTAAFVQRLDNQHDVRTMHNFDALVEAGATWGPGGLFVAYRDNL